MRLCYEMRMLLTHTQHQEMLHEHPCSVTHSPQPFSGNFLPYSEIEPQGKNRSGNFLPYSRTEPQGKKNQSGDFLHFSKELSREKKLVPVFFT